MVKLSKTKNDKYFIDGDISDDYAILLKEKGFNKFKGKWYVSKNLELDDAEIFIEEFNNGDYDDIKDAPTMDIKTGTSKKDKKFYFLDDPGKKSFYFKDRLNKYFRYAKGSYYLKDEKLIEEANELISEINDEISNIWQNGGDFDKLIDSKKSPRKSPKKSTKRSPKKINVKNQENEYVINLKQYSIHNTLEIDEYKADKKDYVIVKLQYILPKNFLTDYTDKKIFTYEIEDTEDTNFLLKMF
jgi:hypothetical protein